MLDIFKFKRPGISENCQLLLKYETGVQRDPRNDTDLCPCMKLIIVSLYEFSKGEM